MLRPDSLEFAANSVGRRITGAERPGNHARGTAWSESHVPCGFAANQERVDTGTVFCPVVVASQGSSLNHSA